MRSPELGELFFMNRYNSSRGLPNWYRVNAVVATLLEKNIYKHDTYTSVQLHLIMEQSEKRNGHYMGMGRYMLNREEILVLKKIFMQ